MTNTFVSKSIDPQLAPLDYNGGPTKTRVPTPGGPATDQGIAALAPLTDQRGVVRDSLGTGEVDIGAYDFFRVAANMVVNTQSDAIAPDNYLSLREAISVANGTRQLDALSAAERALVTPVAGSVNTISFDASLNGKAITLSIAGDNSAGPSALWINSSVVIDGPVGNSGITLAVAAGTPMRLFDVAGRGNLTLQNVTLRDGIAQGSTGGDGQGGAIYNQGGLTIINSTLTGNTSHGAAAGDGQGGAVFNELGTVVITNSTFYDNSAIGGAGAQGLGGALFNHNGTVMVSNSTISRNRVVQGNGSTLIAAGRGIYNLGDSTFTATAIIKSTIIGQDDTAVEDFTGTSQGAGVNDASGSFNLIRRMSGFNSPVITGDPLLGPLQNNGGPTPTMALPPNSPAIDNGAVFGGIWTDQRGVPHPVFKVDIGAYERTSLHIIVNTTADETTDDSTLSLQEAINLINGTLSPDELSAAELKQVIGDDTDTITFDSSLNGQTITLATVGDSSVGPSALLVSRPIIINGPDGDSGITLSAAGTMMRLFHVTSTGNLTLQNLTLSGGTAQGPDGGSGTASGGAGKGGAIYNQGSLNILNDTFAGNTAQGGSGAAGGAGGDGMGGAIFDEGSILRITNSTFTGNAARGGTAGTGGTAGKGLGGAVYDLGQLLINFSTFSGDTVTQGDGSKRIASGREIYAFGGFVNIDNSIVGQSDTSVSDLVGDGATLRSVNSLFNSTVMTLNGASQLAQNNVAGDPLLGPLQDNGGPTQTMALLTGSPGIDVIRLLLSSEPTTDQRGAYRLLPADIGAYEVRPVFNMVVSTWADEAVDTDNNTLSLREAISLANGTLQRSALSPAEQALVTPVSGIVNSITFASSLNGKTITLSTVGDSSVGPSAFLVNSRIAINGPTGNSGVTLSATGTAMRIFYVTSSGDLTLQDLTLSGGTAQGFNGGNTRNGGAGGGSAGLGGAIYNQGTLTLLSSTLSGNTAQGGAGGHFDSYVTGSYGGAGGAGLNSDGGTPPKPSIRTAPVHLRYGGDGGGSNYGGGGISLSNYANGGDGKFGSGGGGGFGGYHSAYTAGSGGVGGFGAGGGGGGYQGAGGSGGFGGRGGSGGFGGGGGGSLASNAAAGGYGGGDGGFARSEVGGGGGAGMGGAVFNEAGTVVITNSTVSGNKALGGDGGAGGRGPVSGGHPGSGLGGGVFNYNGTLTLTNSTFSNNTANQGGRGIVILADGTGATATAEINNTIIGQSDTNVSELVVNQINNGFATVSGGTNLIRTASNSANSDLTGTLTDDPQLNNLASNGGPTQTMALRPGSKAINAGTPVVAPGTDQRGVSRVGIPDIGAFELDALRPQTITFGPLANKTYGDVDFVLNATGGSSGQPVTFASSNATIASVSPGAFGVWFVHINAAGSVTITASQAGNANYAPAPDVAQVLTINKAASVTTTVGAGPFTYTGITQIGGSGTVTGAGTITGSATITYSANSDGTGTADQTNAGTYYVTAHYSGDANHTASDGAAVAIVINKASSATTTVGAGPFTYDGTTHAGGSGTVAGAGDLSTGATSLTYSGDQVNAGTYYVTAHYAGDANHTASNGAAVPIVIDKASSTTITLGAGPFTYTGSAQVGGSGTVSGAGGLNTSAMVTYSANPDGTGVADQINTGTYYVTAHYAGDANHTASDGGAVPIVINKATASIMVTPYRATYDATSHTATGTATGVNGENLSAGLNLSGTTHTNAGSYAGETWSFHDASGNYQDASGTITDSIARADATVKVSGYTGVYDATFHGVTSTVAGVDAGGQALGTSLDLGASFKNVTGGTAHWVFNGGSNYKDQSGDVAIVISKANATVNVSGYTGVYDAAFHGATGAAMGVGGENAGTLDLGATFTDVPGGVARWVFTGNGNYKDQSGDVAIVIRKADPPLVVGADAGGGPQVNVYNVDGTVKFSFFAWQTTFTGGVRVDPVDVNGDGVPDIVVGAGPGAGAEVKVFDGKTAALLNDFFAWPAFTGGVYAASGFFNGTPEIVVGAGAGGNAELKIFNARTGQLLNDFLAWPTGTFSGGVRVAVGDVDGDGTPDVIAGAGVGAAPEVKVFNGKTLALIRDYLAFRANFAGGVFVTVADLNEDGKADIVVGAGKGGGPQVSVFESSDSTRAGVLASFFAFPQAFSGGVRVDVADVNGDGIPDILSGAGAGGGPQVSIFDGSTYRMIDNFFGFDQSFVGGVFV